MDDFVSEVENHLDIIVFSINYKNVLLYKNESSKCIFSKFKRGNFHLTYEIIAEQRTNEPRKKRKSATKN